MRYFNSILYIGLCSIVLASCVTQKKKDDVSKLGKVYHNTTARYNGYYNADLLIQESILQLEQQHVDNYSQLLPIYKYVEAPNPKAVAENLDLAMEKVSVVVNLHRVSQWTDDCYLLFGQAQFLKQEYESAEETFEYMTAEFHPSEVAAKEAKSKSKKQLKKAVKRGETTEEDKEAVKQLSKKQQQKLIKKKRKQREKERNERIKEIKKARKKGEKAPPPKNSDKLEEEPTLEESTDVVETKDTTRQRPAPGSISLGDVKPIIPEGEPEKYFIKHRPVYQEAVLWLARTYIEREKYNQAERLIKQLETSGATFPDVRAEAMVAKAHFYIRQKKYDQAVPALESAIEQVKDNHRKARLAFILGQIHQMAKRGNEAYAAFEKVLSYNPGYEMEFSARLNLATAIVNSETESVKQLERMLKEEKNKEFRDQIYFALAQIALKNSDRAAAFKYLRNSLDNSTNNRSQKAESYLLMADLHFEDQDFVQAKLYYDSTLMLLPMTDERYGRVNNTAHNLDGIAQNLQNIALQDSLIRLSRLSDEEKRELAAKIKKEREEKRLADLKAKANQQSKNNQKVPSGPALQVGSPSKFWAYNERETKQGLREFQKKWGNRVLEDNWRRSNKRSFAALEESAAAEALAPSALTQEEIDEIFQDVPKNDKELAAAHRQIESAMFALATLYRDKIQNYEKAIETFENLINRYPQTQYILDVMYYLHLCYKDLGDEANAQLYYDKIVKGYPETRYAKLLQDPNFANLVNEKANKLNRYYDETYSKFTARQYSEAYEMVKKVGEQFGTTNSLQPRFALLGAMCLGNLEGRDAYVDALNDILAKYPDEPEAARAREILRLLGEKVASGPGQERNLPAEAGQIGNYKPNDTQLHYVIVVFNQEASLNDAKVAVSDFNGKYFKLQRLRMNNIYLDNGEQKLPIIAIRSFKDRNEAMVYYDTVAKNKADFLDEGKYSYELLPISQDNYRELLKNKQVEEYKIFFQQHYLQ